MSSENLTTKAAMSVGIIRNRGTEVNLPESSDTLKAEVVSKA
jgi:hypothetical protein